MVQKAFRCCIASLCLMLVSPLAIAQEQTINLRDAELQAFIDDVSIVTGYTFIVGPEVRGQVTITSQTALSPDEFFQVFLSTLRVQGYTAIRTAPGIYQIVPEGDGARAAGPTTDTDSGDLYQTSVIRLRNISAQEAIRSLGSMTSESGSVNASEAGNLVVINDYGSNIRSMESVLRSMDRDTSVTEMVSLENISATEMTRVIERLRNRTALGEDDQRFSVTVAPISASNSILIRGEADDVREMIALTRRVDAISESNQSFRVIYLNHADGESLIPILEQIATALSPTEGSQSGRMANSIGYHAPTNSIIMNAEPDLLRELEQVIERLDIRRPQVLIEAIIVEISDTAARDLGVQYVLAGDGDDATPFSYSRFGGNQVDLLALTGALSSPGGLVGDANSDDGQSNTTLQQVAIGSLLGSRGGVLGIGGQSNDGTLFGLILNALENDTESNILSKPEVTVLDNEQASLTVGQEIPITTGEALGSNNTNPFRTIDRQEVGVKLDVIPQINEGDTIRLTIQQEVSSVAGPVSASSFELVTNTRKIDTTVLADDGEIIVLGGLISRDQQQANDQVPGLGRIPGLGRLFRSDSTSEQRQNLMVFIRPTIIRSAEEMRSVSQRNLDFMAGEQRRATGSSNLEEIVDFMLGQDNSETLASDSGASPETP